MKSEILSKSISSILFKIGGLCFSYAFYWLISNQNGAESSGHFFIAMAVLNVATIISLKGLNTSFLKQVSKYRESSKNYIKWVRKVSFNYVVPSSIVLTVIVFLCADLIACRIFNDCKAAASVKIISIGILPFSLFSFYSEGFRGLKQIKLYELMSSSLRFIVAVIVLIVSANIFAFQLNPAVAILVGIILTFIISYFFWIKYESEIKNKSNIKIDAFEIKKLYKVSNKFFFASSVSFVNNWGTTFFLGILGSITDVGIYNIAMKIAMLTKLPLLSVNAIAAPKFAEDSSIKSKQSALLRATKYIFFSSLPLVLVLLVFNESILKLFGSEFTQGSSALMFLLAGQLIAALAGSVGHYLQMTEGENQFQRGVTFSLLINVALCMLLIPSLGIVGASIANMLAVGYRNVYFVYIIYRRDKVLTVYYPRISTWRRDD
jgi:O-antigen/teichoic acid export membrane protein